jgi:sigma-B regulation protein RsbU (phosphoserine phosphatase)
VFASAGHNPLVRIRGDGNRADLVKTKGFPLGMVEPTAYAKRIEKGCVNLSRNDWVVLYTDGINEAQNADGEEFGMDRFVELMDAHRQESSEAFVAGVLSGHEAFVGNAPQFDDITLIAIKWLGRTADNRMGGLTERINVARH